MAQCYSVDTNRLIALMLLMEYQPSMGNPCYLAGKASRTPPVFPSMDEFLMA